MIGVHLVVQFELENLLTLLHKEVADSLGDGVFHVPEDEVEVSIDSLSHFVDEHVSSSLHWHLLLLRWLLLAKLVLSCSSWTTWASWLSIWILLVILLLRHDISSIVLVVLIVSEQIVLL